MNQNFKDLLSTAAQATNAAWEALAEAEDHAPDEDLQFDLKELRKSLGKIDDKLAAVVSAIADAPNEQPAPTDDMLEREALGDYEVHDGLSTGEREDIERQLTAKEQQAENCHGRRSVETEIRG